MPSKTITKLTACILSAAMLIQTGCMNHSPEPSAPTTETPTESDVGTKELITDDFLANFMVIAAVPHQSKHEKAISDTLKGWAEAKGLLVRQNEVNDLFFDVSATPGYENLPLTALQAHMDMVCVAEEGKAFDPLTDPVSPIVDRESGLMTADGTSLGADDGAGLSMIMSIVNGRMEHGPLRIVFTVDEEEDMTGALAVTPDDLKGVKYLINLDNEQSDIVTVSTAADSNIIVTGDPIVTAPAGDLALTVSVSGLLGGHSGVMIHEGRCNGILALAKLLTTLRESVDFELASFSGGAADNAIPAKAAATIVLSSEDRDNAVSILESAGAEVKEQYAAMEKNMDVSYAEAVIPDSVLEDRQTGALLTYLTDSLNGVCTMSQAIDGLVESSSNLGQISVSADGIEIRHMPRSSDAEKLKEIETFQKELAETNGFDVTITGGSRAWPVKTDSVLVPAIQKIYRDINGEEITVNALHAGLECGAFSELVPGLDMVSIGPDIKDVHSPDETLYLDSIQRTWSLLEQLLIALP